MILVKKLAFALPFLALLAGLILFASPFLKTAELIFSLNWQTFYQLLSLCVLILASALIFTIFAALSLDWRLILPVTALAAFIPLLFTSPPLSFVLGFGIAASLFLSYINLESRMKSYLTFQGTTLLSPIVKRLAGFLILTLSVSFYFSVSKQTAQSGFEIPDSLIDNVLKITPSPSLPVQGFTYGSTGSPQPGLVAQLPQVTPEQLELLKKNPSLLRQYGIDPKTLDNLTTPPAKPTSSVKPSAQTTPSINPATEMIRPLIKNQLQNMLKPYQKIIPAVLALLLFLTLQSFVAVLEIFLSPIIWLVFYTLEKTGFVRFEVEMRQVKKLTL